MLCLHIHRIDAVVEQGNHTLVFIPETLEITEGRVCEEVTSLRQRVNQMFVATFTRAVKLVFQNFKEVHNHPVLHEVMAHAMLV